MPKKNENGPGVGASRGKPVTEADSEPMATEAEVGYDVATFRPRGGRPPMGSGPDAAVPVRRDPELRAAVEARATADATTTSEAIREALRRFLEVA